MSLTCGCPNGYIPSPDNSNCIRVTTTPAIPGSTTYTVVHGNSISAYGVSGANFYDDATGRPLPIIAASSPNRLEDASSVTLAIQTHVSNTLWGNGGSPLNGRLNTAGVWAAPLYGSNPVHEWIGFTSCINIPAAGSYCIAMAADNRARFKINGQIIAELNNGGTFSFNAWHVIPFTLQAGINIIELEGENDGSFAAFAGEIYDATVSQLAAMTTTIELDAVTVFSTLDQVGLSFQTGENSGYSCPPGFALDTCDGGLVCSMIERTDFIQCCYSLLNCETSLSIITNTDISVYIGQIVTLFNYEGCWTVSTSSDCTGAIPIVVTSSYLSCESCVPICYRLTDCAGGSGVIITNTDLAAYIGQVIKLKHCNDMCWFVQLNRNCVGAIPVVVVNSYIDCTSCLPPVPEPIPLELHPRKVKPGYSTPGCNPEYTEKVNCSFSEALYNQIMSERYGIKMCCDTDSDKWEIKKELLDLRAIYDPNLCKSTINRCCPPTCSEAFLNVYNPTICPAPIDSIADLIVIIPCPAPVDSSAYLYVASPKPHTR